MDPTAVLAVDRRSLGEEVAERLREAILTGSLTPGQHLREEELSVALNVSRSPVRDALSRLSAEKLLIIRPYRGAVVARISIHDMEEVYTLRASLEALAVGLAIERSTPHDLAALRAVAVQVPEESGASAAREFAELDVTFHDLIYRAARHERLYSFWSLLRPHISRFLLWRNMVNADYRDIYSTEHEELVECIAVGEVERAQAMIASHLQGAYRRLEDAYNRQHGGGQDEDDAGRQPSPSATATARAADGPNWGPFPSDSSGAQRHSRRNTDPRGSATAHPATVDGGGKLARGDQATPSLRR